MLNCVLWQTPAELAGLIVLHKRQRDGNKLPNPIYSPHNIHQCGANNGWQDVCSMYFAYSPLCTHGKPL